MPNNSKMVVGSDAQLVEAALSGDTASFGKIVERYWKMAVSLTLSKINDITEAEDIAQESFIKAYSQLGKLRDKSRFAGWLSRIVRQQCVNHIRQRMRREAVIKHDASALERLGSGLAVDGNPGLSEQQARFVRQSVRRLPEKFQEVIIMRFVAGLTSAEIAKQLGKRHGTVRVGLHRAYRILRKELAPLLEEVK